MTKRVALAFICLLLVVAPAAAPAVSAAPPVKELRVQVSRNGFQPPELDVAQGERVAITFVYADTDLDFPNIHIIKVKEYGLQTPELSPEHPEHTLTFTASQSGSFTMACVAQCQGHKQLQDGVLKVAAGQTVQPASLALEVQPRGAGEPGFLLIAALQDAGGNPVAGTPVLFTRQASMLPGQAPQPVRIKEALTGADGRATITWVPRQAGEEHLAAAFSGTPGLAPAIATRSLAVPLGAVSTYAMAPAKLNLVVGNWLIWVVLGAVWSLYATVVYQLSRIPGAAHGHSAPAAPPLDLAAPGARASAVNAALRPRPLQLILVGGALVVGITAVLGTSWASRGQVALAGNADTHKEQVDQLLATATDLATHMAALEARTEALSRQVEDLGATADELHRGVSGVDARLVTLERQVTAWERRSAVPASGAPAAGPVTPGSAARPGDVVEVKLEAYSFGWDPQEIVVPQGSRVRLVVRNNLDRHTPELAAPASGAALPDHGIGIEAYGIDVKVAAGESQVVEFLADTAGEFPIECTVWCGVGKLPNGTRVGHPDMVATLIVR